MDPLLSLCRFPGYRLRSGGVVRTVGTRQGQRLRLEASLPTVAYGHNVVALSPQGATEILSDLLLPEVRKFATITDDPITLARVDTVQDLQTDTLEVGTLLRAFEKISTRKGVERSLRRSRSQFPETLMVRNSRGVVRMYNHWLDKVHRKQTAFPEMKRHLRLEVESRHQWLREGKLRTVKDLVSREALDRLHMKGVAWAGLDREVLTRDVWARRATEYMNSLGWSATIQRNVIGLATIQAAGITQEASRLVTQRYGRVIRAVGAEATVEPSHTGLPITAYRLDLQTERVIAEVA